MKKLMILVVLILCSCSTVTDEFIQRYMDELEADKKATELKIQDIEKRQAEILKKIKDVEILKRR